LGFLDWKKPSGNHGQDRKKREKCSAISNENGFFSQIKMNVLCVSNADYLFYSTYISPLLKWTSILLLFLIRVGIIDLIF
jgi:hypothetical protein